LAQGHEGLLTAIARTGWNERVAARFMAAYETTIRRVVVSSILQLGLLEHWLNADSTKGLISHFRGELYENTVSDVWVELLGGVVRTYLDGYERGTIRCGFATYLGGVVRNLVIRNARELHLLPSTSVIDELKAICRARQPSTRERHIAKLKYRLEQRVEDEILSACPSSLFERVSRLRHRAVDYFFEVCITQRCSSIMSARSADVITDLVGDWAEAEFERAIAFVGRIVPYDADQTSVDGGALSKDEEILEAALAAKARSN